MYIKKWLILVGALGLALRIALALTIKPVLIYDSLEYHQYAKNLATEHRYYANILNTPQGTISGKFYSLRAPGYVFFVAAVYKLFNFNTQAVCLIQAFLDFVSGIFVYLIARNWLKPKHSFYAFLGWQILLVYVPMLMSEAFFMFWFLFSLWILAGTKRTGWSWLSLSALSWGIIILTKPEMIIFVPLIFCYLVLKNYSRTSLAKAVVWLTIMTITILPWLWREKNVHNRFVWITTRGGMTFFDGNYLPIEKRKVFAIADKHNLDEAELDTLFYQLTFNYLKEHPRHYFKAALKRLAAMFEPETYNGLGRFFLMPLLEKKQTFTTALAFTGYFLFLGSKLIMIIGLVSAILLFRRFKELILIYFIPILILLFHFALFHAKPRYLIPAYPCLCIFFALAMERLGKITCVKIKDQKDKN